MKEEMVKLVLSEIPSETIADAAASAHAVADIFTCQVKDSVIPEITVGHALVMVAYGSELSIGKIKKALVDAGSVIS